MNPIENYEPDNYHLKNACFEDLEVAAGRSGSGSRTRGEDGAATDFMKQNNIHSFTNIGPCIYA